MKLTISATRTGNFWYDGYYQLLISGSFSDLCLKVYFSGHYTEAEFIILNAALLRQRPTTWYQEVHYG